MNEQPSLQHRTYRLGEPLCFLSQTLQLMAHAELSQKVVRPRCGILKKGKQLKVVTSPVEQMMILKSCHSDAAFGHYGVTMTWRRVAERFYWKGMVADSFYFYDTSKVFREENSGTDLTFFNRDPSGDHILW